jgi:hypothetical protein
MTLVRKPGVPGVPLAPLEASTAGGTAAPPGPASPRPLALAPERPKKGLIDAPSSPLPAPAAAVATAMSAERVGQPFTSFMKVETYDVAISRPSGVETVRVSALRGPGRQLHDGRADGARRRRPTAHHGQGWQYARGDGAA